MKILNIATLLLFFSIFLLKGEEVKLKWSHDDPRAKFIVEQKVNNSPWYPLYTTKSKEVDITTRVEGVYSYRIITIVNGIRSDPSEEVSIKLKGQKKNRNN